MALKDIFIAAVTPFKNEQVDHLAIKENIKKWCETDISGILILGSTSEFVSLNFEEKVRIIATAREAIPADKTMIAGIGNESVFETIKLGNTAAELGAEYTIVVNPHYYKPLLNESVLFKYFSSVADKSTVPVLLYNIPKFTGINLSISLISKLARHENIIGIKDSSGNLAQYLGLIDIPDFTIFTGDLMSLVQTALMGIDGGIFAFANAVPQEICDVFELLKQDQSAEAVKKINPILQLAGSSIGKFGFPGLKKLMEFFGYNAGDSRLPFLPLNPEQAAGIKIAYESMINEKLTMDD